MRVLERLTVHMSGVGVFGNIGCETRGKLLSFIYLNAPVLADRKRQVQPR